MEPVLRTIEAPADVVWSFLSDLERWGELLPTVTSVTRLDGPGPIGVGSRFRVRQPGIVPATYEVTDWRPGQGFIWAASSPGIRAAGIHELREVTPGRTELTLNVVWTGLLAPLMRMLLRGRARPMVEQEAAAFDRLATAA